jgi:hypothetical protein
MTRTQESGDLKNSEKLIKFWKHLERDIIEITRVTLYGEDFAFSQDFAPLYFRAGDTFNLNVRVNFEK